MDLPVLALRLRWPDTQVMVAENGVAGLEVVEREAPDLVVLASDLQEPDLFHTIQAVRAFSRVPLVVVSGRSDEVELIKAIELGADDYLRVPCSLMELTMRLVAVLRRCRVGLHLGGEGPIRSGPLLMDPGSYEAFIEGRRLVLTPTEFKLLYSLARHRGMVLSPDTLERIVWGNDGGTGELVKKYVQRVRRKLQDDPREPRWIVSVRGMGYTFVGPGAAVAPRLERSA